MANHKKTAKKRKARNPLPKVGSPKDEAYILKRSREDIVDFGMTRGKPGPWNAIILALVAILLTAGGIALIIFT